MADNGLMQPQVQSAASPEFRLVIEWNPMRGQLSVTWPQVDDTIKLGMLEMAKTTLIENRVREGIAPSRIVQPRIVQ